MGPIYSKTAVEFLAYDPPPQDQASNASLGSYDIRIELLAGDGALLAHSETRLKISDDNKTLAASADAPEISAFTGSLSPPLPQDGVASESSDSSLKVTPVKTLEIKPGTPRPAPPAGLAAAQPGENSSSAEWVQIINAVNLRPRPDKSSKTIKVAKKGAKLHVLARHKGWVQVSDPTTSVKGWVYGRFVKPAGPPA